MLAIAVLNIIFGTCSSYHTEKGFKDAFAEKFLKKGIDATKDVINKRC
jgi:hypothetical protein